MSDYAAYSDLQVIGKGLFGKKYQSDFLAIYYDEKFYAKKEWPKKLNSYKFVAKGEWWKTPERLTLPRGIKEDEKMAKVTYSPNEAEYNEFLNNVAGDFKILDSAKYESDLLSTRFTVYNIYDEKNHRYVIFVIGRCKELGKSYYSVITALVQDDLRKYFQSTSW